jgi:hypothetical protein
MIIDLTKAFNFVHEVWDFFGILLAIGFGLGVPIVLVVASIIKIGEHKKSKLENKGE